MRATRQRQVEPPGEHRLEVVLHEQGMVGLVFPKSGGRCVLPPPARQFPRVPGRVGLGNHHHQLPPAGLDRDSQRIAADEKKANARSPRRLTEHFAQDPQCRPACLAEHVLDDRRKARSPLDRRIEHSPVLLRDADPRYSQHFRSCRLRQLDLQSSDSERLTCQRHGADVNLRKWSRTTRPEGSMCGEPRSSCIP